MTVPRATLALFARLCVAEAQHGVWNGTPSQGHYEPHSADDADHLKGLARQADEATALHLTASSAHEVGRLIAMRGRPGLGQMLSTLQSNENPASLCEFFAKNVENGTKQGGHGFFERNETPTEEGRQKVAAALRWAASRFRAFHVPLNKPG